MTLTTAESGAKTRCETYNADAYDASTNRYGLAGAGYKDADNSDIAGGKTGNYPQSLDDVATLTDAVARMSGEAETAKDAAEAARDAALAAAVASPTSTSSTSNAITSSGTVTFTIAGDIPTVPFQVGQYVKAYVTGSPAVFIYGLLTAVDSGTEELTIDISKAGGSGTHSAWTIITMGPPGEDASVNFGTTTAASIDTADTIMFGDVSDGEQPKKETLADIFTLFEILQGA